MANIFIRKPIPGGDEDAWAPYNDAQNENSYGVNTCKLYDDAGALKLTIGRIGINDGTNEGVCKIDTVTTIDIALCSNSNWCKIEMSVSGTSVTFEASDIAGATDPAALSNTFANAYRGDRGAFYITATKRCIGLAWKNAGGTLEGIINCKSFIDGWIGYCQSDDADDIPYHFKKIIEDSEEKEGLDTEECLYYDTTPSFSTIQTKTIKVDLGDWNMDTTGSITITWANINITDHNKVIDVQVIIRNDNDQINYPLDVLGAAGPGGWWYIGINTLNMSRVAGELFDSNQFDSTSYNRGWAYVTYEV